MFENLLTNIRGTRVRKKFPMMPLWMRGTQHTYGYTILDLRNLPREEQILKWILTSGEFILMKLARLFFLTIWRTQIRGLLSCEFRHNSLQKSWSNKWSRQREKIWNAVELAASFVRNRLFLIFCEQLILIRGW